jgi:SAM-dependent methyltransferase
MLKACGVIAIAFCLGSEALAMMTINKESKEPLDIAGCQSFLNSAFDGLVVPKRKSLDRMLAMIRWRLAQTKPTRLLSSQYFANKRPATRERFNQIFWEMSDPTTPQRREMHQLVFAHRSANEQWGLYLSSCYERLLAYVPEYWRLLTLGSGFLPASGEIAVLGTGPGSDAAVIMVKRPHRMVVGYDRSQIALDIAYGKFNGLGSSNLISPWQFRTVEADITELDAEDIWDGVFMSNVLYSIPDQESMLRAIAGAMKPGAIFVLNNPLNKMAISDASKIKTQWDILSSAYENGSVATELEYAIALITNYEFTVLEAKIFLPRPKWKRSSKRWALRCARNIRHTMIRA